MWVCGRKSAAYSGFIQISCPSLHESSDVHQYGIRTVRNVNEPSIYTFYLNMGEKHFYPGDHTHNSGMKVAAVKCAYIPEEYTTNLGLSTARTNVRK